MNKELLFAQTLEQVKKLAAKQGNCISEEQVQEAFAPLAFSGEQLQMVYDYLLKHKIGIGQPLDMDDYLTEEEKNYLEEYLEEVEALGSLTEGEKEGYTLSAMAGDTGAQARLTEGFLKDVADIAKLYAGQGVYLEDLIGEGNVALAVGVTMLGCAENAKEAQGMLMKMVMDAMEDYIAENAAAEKIDQKIVNKVNKVSEKARELSEELRRKVTVEELSQESGLSVNQIREAMRLSGNKIEEIEAEDGQ